MKSLHNPLTQSLVNTISMPRISYWGDIFSFFQTIQKVSVRGNTVTVTGIKSGQETELKTSYQHQKVAKEVAKKLRNTSGI
ncbi:hypothetical protein WCWAEYFT_CDS0053 [Vibrio phage VB_VaC_TDDLMA]